MAHPILPMVVAIALSSAAPTVDLNAQSKDPFSLAKANPGMIIIAGDRRPSPADGDDPRGPDPRDEQRSGSPGDKHRKDHKAPTDPYGGSYPNDKKPYDY
jgi:hypothetical protein